MLVARKIYFNMDTMLMETLKQIKTAVILMILLAILTGVIYPGIVTIIAQLGFPWQANGSILQYHGQKIGSMLIGQQFFAVENFWGRPSATTGFPYNPLGSSGSNQGPSNPGFLATVQRRINHLTLYPHPINQPIPVDLVTASGSGLDPEVSPLAILYQIPRVAAARHIGVSELTEFITHFIKQRTLMIMGEPRINILELNLALKDRYAGTAP